MNKTSKLEIRMTEDGMKELFEEAAYYGISRPELIRRAINYWYHTAEERRQNEKRKKKEIEVLEKKLKELRTVLPTPCRSL